MGADRIGHGIRAAEDQELMRRLRDDDIPLEVCITSNVCTGAVPSFEAHPVRRLYDAGVPITINTDDPALFRTSLDKEYEIAEKTFGIPAAELAANSLRYRATNFSRASSSLPASDQRP
jgi:adenosine deaminase